VPCRPRTLSSDPLLAVRGAGNDTTARPSPSIICHHDPSGDRAMRRVLIVYLVVYYLLVAGAVATLWRSGVIDRLHAGWTYSLIALALTLGALLWITSRQ
jgi:hypothetical protein